MEKKKWFSWGWLIFWCIVEPALGILYLLYKYFTKNDG